MSAHQVSRAGKRDLRMTAATYAPTIGPLLHGYAVNISSGINCIVVKFCVIPICLSVELAHAKDLVFLGQPSVLGIRFVQTTPMTNQSIYYISSITVLFKNLKYLSR